MSVGPTRLGILRRFTPRRWRNCSGEWLVVSDQLSTTAMEAADRVDCAPSV